MSDAASNGRGSWGKRFGLVFGLGVLALLTVLGARTLLLTSRQVESDPAPAWQGERSALAERLSEMLGVPTVARGEQGADLKAWGDFHALLERLYPRVQRDLERKTIDGSFFIRFAGEDEAADPILLLAHLDVVPVDEPEAWTHPPFSGAIEDGYVWGRGAIDDKGSLCAILEAFEMMLEEGRKPARTVYLCVGHDEEVGGERGAARLATVLEGRGVRAYFVLDEGGAVLDGVVPGFSVPVALVGIAEKGYLSVELSASGVGGHSSMPPSHTAVGRVARAVSRLEAHPFPARIDAAMGAQLAFLAPEAPFSSRVAMANRWLFDPLLRQRLLASPKTAAAIRTTVAATMFDGGVGENVLPASASATINLRLLPGDSIEWTLARLRGVIDDEGVDLRVLEGAREASKLSDPDGEAFRSIQRTIAAHWTDAIVAPYLVVGGTDARHYEGLSANVLRFSPIRMSERDLERFHGRDERLSIDALARAVSFYRALIDPR